jgi:hypothetical protein
VDLNSLKGLKYKSRPSATDRESAIINGFTAARNIGIELRRGGCKSLKFETLKKSPSKDTEFPAQISLRRVTISLILASGLSKVNPCQSSMIALVLTPSPNKVRFPERKSKVIPPIAMVEGVLE